MLPCSPWWPAGASNAVPVALSPIYVSLSVCPLLSHHIALTPTPGSGSPASLLTLLPHFPRSSPPTSFSDLCSESLAPACCEHLGLDGHSLSAGPQSSRHLPSAPDPPLSPWVTNLSKLPAARCHGLIPDHQHELQDPAGTLTPHHSSQLPGARTC